MESTPGGIKSPTDEFNGLRSPVPNEGVWVPPEIWLSGGDSGPEIAFASVGADKGSGHLEENLGGLLEEFVALQNADPSRYLRFAKRWGVMELCEQHLLPSTHAHQCGARRYQEPLVIWRMFSSKAGALLQIAAELHDDQVPDRKHWRTYFGDEFDIDQTPYLGELPPKSRRFWPSEYQDGFIRHRPSKVRDRSQLAACVNNWLAIGNVHPIFSWKGRQPEIRLGGGGLIRALAVRLAFAVAASKGFWNCSNCGRPYSPARKPQRNRRNYCPTCRNQGVPERDRARDYADRVREKRLQTLGEE